MSDDYDNYASGYSDGFGEGRQEREAEVEGLRQENAKLRVRIDAALMALDMDSRSSIRVVVAREYLKGNEPA